MILSTLLLILGMTVFVLSDETTTTTKKPSEDNDSCNKTTIGGQPVDIQLAPWTVSIMLRDQHKCVGVIYNPNYILTAAKCVDGYLSKAFKLLIGIANRNVTFTNSPVCEIKTHEKYLVTSMDNNVALLKLCIPIKTSETIKEIQLADKMPEDNTKATITGWASFLWRMTNSAPCLNEEAQKLQQSELKIFSKPKCLEVWPKQHKILHKLTDNVFCTEKVADKICSFDPGAPLVFGNQLVGILSRGGCSSRPDVYLNILRYKDWLETNSK
ncbi:trypsin alpha-3 [Drosophila ficusphila]|uniref:trypsin alpha-3 n=1 Tax=Drosophila ficusphila TaxID=30025 RepID=UPI0007E8046A|nr:trypsin alpha-3 [Drosophila ficusphila]